MAKWILALWLAPVLLGSQTHLNFSEGEPVHRLTLRVYNYANVDAGVLKDARVQTERILRQVGVETGWLNCPTSPQDLAANRACSKSPGADHVILNLLPDAMSMKYGFRRGIFGFALPTAKGQPGTKISLFFERVLDLAYYGEVGTGFEDAQAIILGHMMAHEIGHLLLGPDSHGPSGVMSFPWVKRTLTQMERGRLQFTDEEAVRIRREVLRRAHLADRASARPKPLRPNSLTERDGLGSS